MPFEEASESTQLLSSIGMSNGEGKDLKCWSLMMNGSFLVKSFYSFLNDGFMLSSRKFLLEGSLSEEGQHF